MLQSPQLEISLQSSLMSLFFFKFFFYTHTCFETIQNADSNTSLEGHDMKNETTKELRRKKTH